MKTSTKVPVKQILPAFLAAMRAGYAGFGKAKIVLPELPGSRLIVSESGGFVIKDLYFVTAHSAESWGSTMISYDGETVWRMNYQGSYPEHVIPFLKRALAVNYNTDVFFGGRGPQTYCEEGLMYENIVQSSDPGNWRKFHGFERVSVGSHDRGFSVVGHHSYDGRLIVPEELPEAA